MFCLSFFLLFAIVQLFLWWHFLVSKECLLLICYLLKERANEGVTVYILPNDVSQFSLIMGVAVYSANDFNNQKNPTYDIMEEKTAYWYDHAVFI